MSQPGINRIDSGEGSRSRCGTEPISISSNNLVHSLQVVPVGRSFDRLDSIPCCLDGLTYLYPTLDRIQLVRADQV